MKMIIASILTWMLGKLKISVMIGVEIDTKKQYCKPRYKKGITGLSNLNGIGFLGWNYCFFCRAENTYIGFDSRKERGPIDKKSSSVLGVVIGNIKDKTIIKNLELHNIGIEDKGGIGV